MINQSLTQFSLHKRVFTFVPLAMLRLSLKMRFLIVLVSAVPGIICSLLFLPAPLIGLLLVVPTALACWCFGWRGFLVSVGTGALISGVRYEVIFGRNFWTSAQAIALLGLMLAGLIIASFRHMADLVKKARQQSNYYHQLYTKELAIFQWRDRAFRTLEHELRTPLTHLQGYLDLLQYAQEHQDMITTAGYIQQAQQGCEEVISVITSALEEAYMPGKRHLNLNTFSLKQEVQTVLGLFDPRVWADYRLDLDIPENCLAYADQRAVRQVIRNLLTNALKYTPRHTCITIRVDAFWYDDEQADQICVRVQDQGDGISPDQQACLFQQGVRLFHGQTERIPGSGLGLFICKQLVEAMGGQIWVESAGQPGAGACFAFTLANACSTESAIQQSPLPLYQSQPRRPSDDFASHQNLPIYQQSLNYGD